MDLYFCCLLENGDADVGMSCLERKLNRFPWISLEIWRVRSSKIVHENNFYVTWIESKGYFIDNLQMYPKERNEY